MLYLVYLFFGGGQVYATPEEEIYNLGRYLKAEYFIAPASVMAISFIKFSIVAFYRRIFTVKLFMNISLVVGVICVLWMITGMIGNLLYCIPMESFWDKAIEGKCFNFDNWFLAMETIDLLLDAIILALPIKTIMGLQLSAHKKTTLLTIFLLGGFVVITGIIRIVLVYQPNQTLISFTKASLWTCIHLGVAILCACLPTYGPLWPSIMSMGNSIRSLVSTRTKTTTTGKSSSTSAISANGSYYKRMAYSDSDQIHLTAVSVGEIPRTKTSGIRVERDFDVV